MIKNVVILGGYVNALGAARQAGRMGLNVSLITTQHSNLACYSRYVKQHFYYSSEEELTKILKNNAQKGTFLYPTGDEEIEFMDKNRDWLSELYHFIIPNSEAIRIFAAKINSYRFAERYGIPYPHSYYFDELGQIPQLKEENYPEVLKPSIMYDFRDIFGKKAFVCHDELELKEKCKYISQKGYSLDKMIVQEFMDGGPACLYSVGLFAVDGKIQKMIQVNRLRQRPMVLGNSTTYCVSSEVKLLYEYAEKIISITKYSGVAEIEFMYHKGEYKFLEVNMRSWKWHSITNVFGFSFIGECINYINGKKTECENPKKSAIWVDRLTDWIVSIPEILHGRMRLGTFVKSYIGRKEYAVWCWDDMIPAFVYPYQLMRNLLRKIV